MWFRPWSPPLPAPIIARRPLRGQRNALSGMRSTSHAQKLDEGRVFLAGLKRLGQIDARVNGKVLVALGIDQALLRFPQTRRDWRQQSIVWAARRGRDRNGGVFLKV